MRLSHRIVYAVVLGVPVLWFVGLATVVVFDSLREHKHKVEDKVVDVRFCRSPKAPRCVYGDCFMGKCVCRPGYSGAACDYRAAPECDSPICVHFSPEFGTTRAMDWDGSQRWELDIWQKSVAPGDRWQQHKAWLNHYAPLFKVPLGDVLEIGSGPYTQTMYMIDAVGRDTLRSLTLVDPLIEEYLLTVNHVRYRNFTEYPVHLVRAGAEDADHVLRDEAFDVVVMINVVEHCRNAWRVLQTLWNKLKPGGVLVFSEYVYDHRGFFVEAGHEIKLRKGTIRMLLQHFDPMFVRWFDHEGDYPDRAGIYFVGRKK